MRRGGQSPFVPKTPQKGTVPGGSRIGSKCNALALDRSRERTTNYRMKIAYLSAGAAGRYCGTCLHDNTLAAALGKLGVETLLVPTYTPLRTDEESVSLPRVFFGGVNVYLQQKSAVFRHTPWFFDSLLDSPGLLDWLSRRSAGMKVAKL